MAQPDRNSQKENKPRGNEPSFNWRGVILIAIAFALIGLAVLFRGGAYASKDDPDRAIQDYDQAIQLEPTNAVPYLGRGKA